MPVPSQENERSCICVLGASIVLLSTIFHMDFGNVPTLRYFFIFHFVTDRKPTENDMLSNRSVKRIHTQQVFKMMIIQTHVH